MIRCVGKYLSAMSKYRLGPDVAMYVVESSLGKRATIDTYKIVIWLANRTNLATDGILTRLNSISHTFNIGPSRSLM